MAMQRINTCDPVLGIGHFDTVAGQQSYTPLPSGAYFIRQAWWCDPGLWIIDQGGPGYNAWMVQFNAAFGQHIDDIGTYTSLDPSTVSIVLRKSEQVQRWLGSNFAVVNGGAEVYLGPVPRNVRTVYFSFTGQRFANVGDITPLYFDAFWWAAESAALGALATGALAVTRVEDSQEGTAISLNSGSSAAARAATAELKFLRGMAGAPPVEPWLFA